MYREISKLLVYGDLGNDCILTELASHFRKKDEQKADSSEIISGIYSCIKQLLDVATRYGFNCNLWQDYLTFLLMTNENSFTLTAERANIQNGSITRLVKGDYSVFMKLFHYDFSGIEKELGIDCFSVITNYSAVAKSERNYYRSVSEKVRELSSKLAESKDVDEFYEHMTSFYVNCGVGMFGLNKAFRIKNGENGVEFIAINNTDKVLLDDIIGYELQKKELVSNTVAFVSGKPANNVLLYGDAGTGKSTSIKAILNEYNERGLRMIEIYKHQFGLLGEVISKIKGRNYKFIIYIDDLSFEEDEVEYKFLKAVIEGGVETRPDNILIYATSNRRHLIKETWSDRDDMEHNNDVHRSDTMEEKLSLAARFGVSINFGAPDRKLYQEIVLGIAKKQLGEDVNEDELLRLASQWELRHAGKSGRAAQQFVNYLQGKEE